MILANLANFAHVSAPLAMFFQEPEPANFSLVGMVQHMKWDALTIVIIL